MTQYLRFNSPIHNLQVFLRAISKKYDDIPSVIPDGVYGQDTINAVTAFQKKFSLNQTGTTDNSTWDAIVELYKEIEKELRDPLCVRIYPEHGLKADTSSYTPTVYIIQNMMFALSEIFENIPAPSVNGVLDDKTTDTIKAIQLASGLNPDGNVNKVFWDYLVVIYETYVSNDRVAVNSNIT